MSAITLHTQARNAYKAKEYEKALVLFDRAIGRSPSVQLYDHRAACNVKLNDLPAALKDAKRAIHLSREDATGYLRAGQVLSKMDRASVALEIYVHGLKHVRPVGAGYEQLKKAHDLSLGDCAPQNSVDPMTRLPRELALQVLDYLDFRERTRISGTSKGWRAFIMSEPRLWQHLNLSGKSHKKVANRFISKAINIAKKRLIAATLHNLHDFDKAMFALARQCQIERLTLADTGLRGSEFVDILEPAVYLKELRILGGTEMAETILRRVMQQHQSRLEVLQVAYVKRLTSPLSWRPVLSDLPRLKEINITIGYSEEGLTDILASLATGAPSLERLTFHQHIGGSQIGPVTLDLSRCENLTYLNLQVLMSTASDISLPTKLKYLKLAMVSGFPRPDFFARDSAQLASLSHLEEAHVLVPGMDLDRFVALFESDSKPGDVAQQESCPTFMSLLRPSIPANAALHLPHRLHSLESLTMRECLDLTDDKLEKLVSQLPKLQVLDLRGSKVTGASIKSIVQNAALNKAGHTDAVGEVKRENCTVASSQSRTKIQHLILNDCADLGRDAVDWARGMGVKVDFKMTSLERGSKKIRY